MVFRKIKRGLIIGCLFLGVSLSFVFFRSLKWGAVDTQEKYVTARSKDLAVSIRLDKFGGDGKIALLTVEINRTKQPGSKERAFFGRRAINVRVFLFDKNLKFDRKEELQMDIGFFFQESWVNRVQQSFEINLNDQDHLLVANVAGIDLVLSLEE